MENYLNILGELRTNLEVLTVYGCIGFSLALAVANIYSHLKTKTAEKESKEEINKLEQNILGGNRLN